MGKAGQAHRADRRPVDRDGARPGARPRARLDGHPFELVLTSRLSRAADTASLAGFGDVVRQDPDLREWDYGALEGRLTAEIRADYPGWTIWRGPWPDGETIDAVATRADRVIARARAADGDVLVFAHGHLLRVLAARWLDLPPASGGLFALETATVSVLGWEHDAASSSGGTRRAHLPDDDSAPALSAPLRYGRHAPAIRAPETETRSSPSLRDNSRITSEVHHDQRPHGPHRALARRRRRIR